MECLKTRFAKSLYFSPVEAEQERFAKILSHYILLHKQNQEELIVLCIGTDKITGDCLGPLVGTGLKEKKFPLPVFGTLQHPVHALNIADTVAGLKKHYRHPFFLAVDAALGAPEKIGTVTLSASPVSPGKGLQRPLEPVGNISITGITGEASDCASLHLPYTRLYLVNRLASFIIDSILRCSVNYL